jgi:hypothetical protein
VRAHARHASIGSVAMSTGNDRSSAERVIASYGAGSAGSGAFAGLGSGAGIVSGNGSETGSTSMMRFG